MITDRSEFRVHIRRVFFIMIRTFYRWICSHPYLLGCVGFVYLLYRTCPLLFSPLLAASPVLVCTFVLLGTILSFGEPNNIPEIETEPETTTVHDAALFTTEASKDSTVVERGGESFTVERFVSTEKDENDDRPLADEVKRDTQVGFEERAFVFDLEKKGGDGEEEKFIGNDGKHAEQSRESGGSLDEMMKDSKEDQVDVSPVSPWRPMKHEEDENDDDADHDDSLDTSSDGAESSSPDPSMTDIIPMLDELHPLLHSENPRRGIADLEGSDATSEEPDMSSSSDSDEGTESDANSESHEEEGDNKNLEEEEKKEEKEDESKSPIKWTEADEKTVMDLGSLELERNQRLESLIAMRRARNNMRMMAERRLESLIAMRSADVSFKIPPVSTTRRNPFDFPYDDMGLPPIPGSSPSIMFARRNPFDLPYEPNEEKPGLKGDGFEEEFSSQQPKETVFRRHESVRVGPSMLGGLRHDVAEIVLGSAETHVTHHEHDADHQEEGPLSVSSQEYLEELYEEVKEAVDTPVVRLVSPSEDAVVVSTGMVEQLLPVEHTSSTLGYGDTTEHLSALEESPDVVHDIAETPVNRSVAEGIVQEEDKQKDEASVRSVEDIEDEEELMLEDSKDIDPEPVIPEYPVPMDGDVSRATLVDGNHRARMKETESGTIPSWWRNVEPKKKSTPVKKKVIGSSSSVGLAFKEKPWARGRVCPKIKVRER